jgi:hypothetical protein
MAPGNPGGHLLPVGDIHHSTMRLGLEGATLRGQAFQRLSRTIPQEEIDARGSIGFAKAEPMAPAAPVISMEDDSDKSSSS